MGQSTGTAVRVGESQRAATVCEVGAMEIVVGVVPRQLARMNEWRTQFR